VDKKSIVKVHRDWSDWNVRNPAVTTGIFDGVHLGHVSILQRLKHVAWEKRGESVMVTFWPHPRTVLGRNRRKIRLLSSMDEKIILLERLGLDHLVIIPFDRTFSNLTACQFVEHYLVDRIDLSHLVIGYNHQFGKNREGDYETIKACSDKFGFTVEQLEATMVNYEHVSSSMIREALDAGDVKRANVLLGYSYFMQGNVVGGSKIGREIGYPTANLIPVSSLKHIPRDGVYAVWVEYSGSRYKGMLNIGYKPTIKDDNSSCSIEVHILEFNKNLYGEQITVHFVDRIRNEMKFASIDALKNQLDIDRKLVTELLD
jgi:riboflavin kinase/FMN adenylyltransferase